VRIELSDKEYDKNVLSFYKKMVLFLTANSKIKTVRLSA